MQGVRGLAYHGVERWWGHLRGWRTLPRGPSEGWLTFALLMGTVLAAVWSVEQARWVQTTSLPLVAFWATLAGLAMAKTRLPGAILFPSGLLLGALVSISQAATQVEPRGLVERYQALWHRLDLWQDAAFGGGISTDILPFTLILLLLDWVVAFTCAWFLFRYRSVWGALLPSSIALTTNLTYLPTTYSGFLYLYLLLAILLAARSFTLRRDEEWGRRGVEFPGQMRLSTLGDALWFGVVIVILVALLPLRSPSVGPIREAWDRARYPVRQLEEEFARLFSALPSKTPYPGRPFGPTLAFQGRVTLSDEPVLYVETPYPALWRIRSYDIYTSQGWKTGATMLVSDEWEPRHPVHQEYRSRLTVTQRIQPLFGVSSQEPLSLGGQPLDLDGLGRLEVARSQTYALRFDQERQATDLPPDIASAFAALRRQWQPEGQRLTPQQVEALLPRDTVLVDWGGAADEQGQFVLRELQVQRAQPYPPDVLSVRSSRHVSAQDVYQARLSISGATEGELRQASSDYPGWVKDRYLQLPETLPQRVRDLAEELARDATTPYDQAAAIRDYLRTLSYSREIEPPPFDADGVDHFLFTTREGYSDYFASAMTVMLRSVGIPARMAVGYAPGEWDSQAGRFIVRDRDSHGWAEVYFPDYGWIAFEPTPGRDPAQRGVPEFMAGETQSDLSSGENDAFLDDEEDEFPVGFLLGAGVRSGATNWWLWGGLGGGMAFAALLALALAYAWRRTLSHVPTPLVAYARMCHLATLSRLGPRDQQTPYEYSRSIAQAIPRLEESAGAIVQAYVRRLYGRATPTVEEMGEIQQAWLTVRNRLLRRVLFRR